MKEFFDHWLVKAIILKAVIGVIAYLMIMLHITIDDVKQAEEYIEHLHHVTYYHHQEHHDNLLGASNDDCFNVPESIKCAFIRIGGGTCEVKC